MVNRNKDYIVQFEDGSILCEVSLTPKEYGTQRARDTIRSKIAIEYNVLKHHLELRVVRSSSAKKKNVRVIRRIPEPFMSYERAVWEWMIKTLEPDTKYASSVLWTAPVFQRWISRTTAQGFSQGMIRYWDRTHIGFTRLNRYTFKFGVIATHLSKQDQKPVEKTNGNY